MTELLPAILLSSLIGSVHCVAMCGPLVGLSGGARSVRLALVHALGRLTTYAALGAGAGLVGRAVDLAGRLADVQRAASILAALAILGWGLSAVIAAVRARRGAAGGAPDRTAGGRTGGSMLRGGLIRLRGRRPAVRAWLTGTLTGLIPCGWLWAFVVAAAGTGSAAGGALAMAAFWLGTVPAMTGALAVAGPLIAALRRRLPVVTAAVLVLVGLGTLAARWRDAGAPGAERPSCHEVRSHEVPR
jgi:sulfite exporter TauE/SafE